VRAASRHQSLFRLIGLLVVILMIQARFDNVELGKYQITFSKQATSAVATNFQSDSVEDDDCLFNNYYQLPALSFGIMTRLQLLSVEVVKQREFIPRKPIILISCLRI
jgi:hypothetical protein